jgi:hypothetical protein
MEGNMRMGRTYSDQYVSAAGEMDYQSNTNVSWVDGSGFKLTYLLFCFLIWAFLHMSRWISPEECWTVLNVIHGVTTFVFFHWIKGSHSDAQGIYSGLTMYEQIDGGIPYTMTKKFLMVIPAYICWMACHVSNYKPVVNIVNVGMFLLSIIPKVPEMHGVRIFGLNSTSGIDDPIEITNSREGSSPRASARLSAKKAKTR